MARDFIFAVMLDGAALIGVLTLTPDVKGWKSVALTFCGVASIFVVWGLASLYLPH